MEYIQKQLERIEELLRKNRLLEKEFFTLEEAAIYLGQSKSSLYKLTSKKEIPFYVPGGKIIYFRKRELEEWILNGKVASIEDLENEVDEYLSKSFEL